MASRVLVYGGAGTLGKSVIQRFANKGWITYSADISKYSESTHSFPIDAASSTKANVESVCKWLDASLDSNPLNCIVNAAGGFMMDDISSPNFFDQLETMWQWNSLSAFQCGSIAQKYLCSNSSSLLVLTGAAPAFKPTPIMLAYGTSKVVVHHLVKTLAVTESMPKTSKTIGIVPITIDTPPNREAMPDMDWSNWTKPDEFAEKIVEWACGEQEVVNGGLYTFETVQGKTSVTCS